MLKKFFSKNPSTGSNESFYKDIQNTVLLAEITKKIYIKNLKRITDEFFQNKVTIGWVLSNPEQFKEALLKYVDKHHMKISSGTQFVVPLLYLINLHHDIQEANPRLKRVFTNIKYELKEIDDNHRVEGERTDRQKKIDLTFQDIVKIRDSLSDDEIEGKLLLACYTMIPPLRNDFNHVKILDKQPDDTMTGNYLILGKVNKLVINEFKTAKQYEKIVIDLPVDLQKLIHKSLELEPRGFLFANRHDQPYLANSFNKYANRLIKRLLNNESISLTSFRHLYLSDPVLDIKSRTLGERKVIANAMGHSVARQGDYLWSE